jgi:hypothetical protein
MEASTEGQIRVRQVTQYQVTWTERERGAAGAFTVQLVLDHGVDTYVLRPSADDMEVLRGLLRHGDDVYFDLDRKVLMFGNRALA